jgi:hypothetical protein
VFALNDTRLAFADCQGIATWTEAEGITGEMFTGERACMTSVTYSPGAEMFAALVGGKGFVIPADHRKPQRAFAESKEAVQAIAFSNDGTQIAVSWTGSGASNRVQFYDIALLATPDARGRQWRVMETRALAMGVFVGPPTASTMLAVSSDHIVKLYPFR